MAAHAAHRFNMPTPERGLTITLAGLRHTFVVRLLCDWEAVFSRADEGARSPTQRCRTAPLYLHHRASMT